MSELDVKRHSLAHIMMGVITDLYPNTKFSIGPVIDDGFYYDFESDHQFSPDDFSKIESEMKKVIDKGVEFHRKEMSKSDALKYWEEKNQPYKVELINDLEDGTITFYTHGDFTDLCRGPHVQSTKNMGVFKLDRVAGAYWRGDENNTMLQRIYGLAFNTQKEMDEYIEMREEAKKRDHRKLGKELDLFTFSDLVGKGLPLWTERGAVIHREMERFIVEEEIKRGYQHVITPDIAKVDLYRTSGHYPYYKDSMYPPMDIDGEELILRPMACPHHFMLYKDKPRSYRELPMRIAELAKLYRYEQSGELAGLIRVRSFCLADAHIICMPEQARDEIERVIDLIEFVCETFGLVKGEDYFYRLSLGDRENEKKYYKNDEKWDYAESVLRQTLNDLGAPYVEAEDEAAFYGPKVDIQMRNVNGKEDTAFTVQYDFCMPDRFNLEYINAQGKEDRAIVIHRSSVGAIERIIAFLIERYAGVFPLWLAPEQIRLLAVSEKHFDYVKELQAELKGENLRVGIDVSDNTVGKKIKEAEEMKVPYIIVIGDKEAGGGDFQIRRHGHEEQENMNKSDFTDKVKQEIRNRSL